MAETVDPKRIKGNNRRGYAVFFGLILLSVGFGLSYTNSISEVAEGMTRLIKHHGLIPTDSFSVGGIGPAFVNAALVTLVGVIALLVTGSNMGSVQISALLMMYGYAFFGKSIFNVIPLLVGVLLYAAIVKAPLKNHAPMAGFATALGPVVSVLAFHTEVLGPGSPFAITVGVLFGLLCGLLVGKFAGYMKLLIRGNSMYVGGFTVGVVGVLINSLINSLGLGHGPYTEAPVIDPSARRLLLVLMSVIFLYFLIVGFLPDRKGKESLSLLFTKEPKRDYVKYHGLSVALMTVGWMGLLSMGYFILMPGSRMHGQIWAGIFTVAAFSVAGLTPRYLYPFVVGMLFATFFAGGMSALGQGDPFLTGGLYRISSVSTMMATYVGCGMSPLSEKYGPYHSILVGAIYSVVAPNLSGLQGWMNTYNNGFALGLVILLYFTGEFKEMKVQYDLYLRMNKYGFLDKMKK